MAGINVNGIGRNPYADSYLTSAKNRSNTTSKDTFVNAVKKVEESKNSADTSNVMYPGDVTIDYPPRINNAVNNSVVSEKSKDEMSLDEYKQWVMNQISQFPVSGWVRSTFSSGSIVIKEEAFERMKNDPEYENYVLNRVRSAYSVQGLPVGSNNVSFDVIGASPEECYGYAGPVGKSGSETAKEVNANGMGIKKNGMLSHISQMMVQRLNKQMKGEVDVDNIDILGNTTESAIQATKQALYNLDHPLEYVPKSIEVQRACMKEREFYVAFLERLEKL